MLSRGGLPPQHSGGDHNIERAQSGDHTAYRRVQQERPKSGIVNQEVVSIPQAEPRQNQENDSDLKKEKHGEDANQPG